MAPLTSSVIGGLMLFFVSWLSPVHSWVVLSSQSTQLALDSNWDPVNGTLLTTGVLFRTAVNDITLQGASNTDCYIALGDVGGFDHRVVYKTPQICTHFEIFPRPTSDEPSETSPLPSGLAIGMYGDQAVMGTINFSKESTDLPWSNTYDLPLQTFPVGVSSDKAGGVYVGLHATGGLLPPPSAKDPNQDLQNIYDYYKGLTDPKLTEHVISPQVVKVNMRTQQTVWELVLETTGGRSTIGNVIHIPSRDLVVVAGSSNGEGMLVGAGEFSTSWDGYVTLVNATTGKVDVSSANQTYLSADFSMRVQSQVGQDDYILGACASDDNIFLLGTTTGKLKTDDDGNITNEGGGAFVIMLDIDTLNIQWIQQWFGPGVEALKCISNATFIFVAGHVPGGVSLQEDDTRTSQTPSNDQDIFFSLLDTATGNMRWTRQLDSRRPDHLANMQLSRSGDLLFTGNSMDFLNGISDIYTASILQDGFYDWLALPPEDDPIRGDSLPPGISYPGDLPFNGEDDNNITLMVVATIVPCVLFLGIVAVLYRKKATPPKTDAAIFGPDTINSGGNGDDDDDDAAKRLPSLV